MVRKILVAALLTLSVTLAMGQAAQKSETKGAKTTGVLKADEAQRLLPQSVFYAGQTAPVQTRNSSVFRTASGKAVLAGLVDSSGYSSGVAEKYQGFFITEVKLQIDGHALAPGAYGVGAVGDKFVVTDLGANELFSTAIKTDDTLKRPVPLKFAAEGSGFRLYLGKKYVTVQESGK